MKRGSFTSKEDKPTLKQAKFKKFSTEIRVTGMRTRIPDMNNKNYLIINCTSRSKEEKWRQFSPFFLGPVKVNSISPVSGIVQGYMESKTHENAWQYAKVYAPHTDDKNEPTKEYWKWAIKGWDNPKAVRFPMGKGKRPKYSLWNGEKLGYIEARKKIYAPTYAELVVQTEAFKELKEIVDSGRYKIIWIRDFDGYDNTSLGLSLTQVLNEPKRKMGHSFVLSGCLTGNRFWE